MDISKNMNPYEERSVVSQIEVTTHFSWVIIDDSFYWSVCL